MRPPGPDTPPEGTGCTQTPRPPPGKSLPSKDRTRWRPERMRKAPARRRRTRRIPYEIGRRLSRRRCTTSRPPHPGRPRRRTRSNPWTRPTTRTNRPRRHCSSRSHARAGSCRAGKPGKPYSNSLARRIPDHRRSTSCYPPSTGTPLAHRPRSLIAPTGWPPSPRRSARTPCCHCARRRNPACNGNISRCSAPH